ncbi:MAG TPA: barstar family protein [Thermoanaerobaculia bacterium]|nr:barstar family protein [Thermoanaerobaculia bacterium]
MHPEDLARPAWECVHFVSAAGEAAEACAHLAGRPDFTWAVIPAQAWAPEDTDGVLAAKAADSALLDAVAMALGFPAYFGRNWDALDECLRDLGGPGGGGVVLAVEGAAELWARAPRAAGRLVESWLFAAGEQARDGVALHLLFVL